MQSLGESLLGRGGVGSGCWLAAIQDECFVYCEVCGNANSGEGAPGNCGIAKPGLFCSVPLGHVQFRSVMVHLHFEACPIPVNVVGRLWTAPSSVDHPALCPAWRAVSTCRAIPLRWRRVCGQRKPIPGLKWPIVLRPEGLQATVRAGFKTMITHPHPATQQPPCTRHGRKHRCATRVPRTLDNLQDCCRVKKKSQGPSRL